MVGFDFTRCYLAYGKDNSSFRLSVCSPLSLIFTFEIRADAIRVGSVVVVRIAVVVDISKVRRRHNVTQPPVRTIQELPYIFIFPRSRFSFSCLASVLSTYYPTVLHLYTMQFACQSLWQIARIYSNQLEAS